MQHLTPKRLAPDLAAAIAAYTRPATICPPGIARAPMQSPFRDSVPAQSTDELQLSTRAYLGDQFASFREINSSNAKRQSRLAAMLRQSRDNRQC